LRNDPARDESKQPVRILVVDDHQPFRQIVCSMLGTKSEWQVIAEASDGLQAVHKAEELQPDLILLDIGRAFREWRTTGWHRMTGQFPATYGNESSGNGDSVSDSGTAGHWPDSH
jgi:response regulator receiver domain-containing protein